MDWTTCPSRTVVPIEALQQIIFNVYSAVLERVIRDQGPTTKSHFPLKIFVGGSTVDFSP